MRAIISVSDKTGATEFTKGLIELGFEVFSTGGTKKALAEVKIPVHGISDITGFPEILDGRVKTLHPMLLGGVLARRDLPEHLSELKKHKITPVDLVAVNLYPFVKNVSKEGVSQEDALENIDIGGPTLIRAAAKNFNSVIVVCDPADYPMVLEKIKAGGPDEIFRKQLARKAFQHVAVYDTAIAQYLGQGEDPFSTELTMAMTRRYGLRYGENPHQKAAFYAENLIGSKQDTGVTFAKVLWGKELSFNNILDADAAWAVAVDFASPTVAIIKHTNACGLASRDNLLEAYRLALNGDPVAAYGGIVAINRTVDVPVATEIRKTFYEIVIAPDFEPEALKILEGRKDLRILKADLPPGYGAALPVYIDYRHVKGGLLVQTSDTVPETKVEMKVVTERVPSREETADLLFAWRACKHIKSNTIVLVKEKALLGMGAGQPSRIIAAQIAKDRAGDKARGSVMASDAMFPFNDVPEAAGKWGVTAIIQPGGSIRDQDSIDMANKNNIAMVFTGERHFKH
jgi:phosphoribosylaminoimidazolecarboxamide formyltransferase/IMP cyclohydrolase